jgi:sterol 3beta-glucosyltransferase
MNILVLTIGSRGDIQPFVALGKGLKQAGHTVTLATGSLFESFVRENGLNFAPINDEMIRLVDTPEGKAAIESGGSSLGLIKKVMPMLRRMLDDEWTVAQALKPDVIVYHPKVLGGAHLAEKLGIPQFMGMALPGYTPTREFVNPIMPPTLNLGGAFNRFSFNIMRFVSAPYSGTVNAWRQEKLATARMLFPRLLTGRHMWSQRATGSSIRHRDGNLLPTLSDFWKQANHPSTSGLGA